VGKKGEDEKKGVNAAKGQKKKKIKKSSQSGENRGVGLVIPRKKERGTELGVRGEGCCAKKKQRRTHAKSVQTKL